MPHGYPHDSSTPAQRTTNAQGQTAPPGFHYMPDGTLMSDVEHARLYGSPKIIQGFDIDFSDIKASGERRRFIIRGSKNTFFNLEVKNEDNYYYNFVTNTFQAAKTGLKREILSGAYKGDIKFPLVTDDDQYDIYLWAEDGAKHIDYNEVRFGDGSIDINSSTGSGSLLLQKVIYQYTDLTLTISPYSPNGVTDLIKSSTRVDDTITVSRGKSSSKLPFKISCAVNANTKSYQIKAQPTPDDVLSFVEPTIGAAPILLPGEDEYPAVTETAQIQTAGISSSATIVLRTPVPDITVGDMWTSDGAMPAATQYVQSITVDGDGNVTQFVTNTAANHSGSANLTFYARKNYRWPIDTHADKITNGMIVVPSTNITPSTTVSEYKDTVTLLEGTDEERVIIKKLVSTGSAGKKPTVVKGLTTVAPGDIVFDKQQVFALAGDTIKIGGYGERNIYNIYGYRVRFSDLKIELTPITTTTTSAVSNSTSVPVASRNGILDTVSSVSGIGIDTSSAIPTVASGAGAVSGAGTIVLSAAQTLENGITLTFTNAGQTATITGNIEILEAGTANQTLRFDMENLLSIT